ncbi:vWA domain-containing protein [Rhodopirellula bahusiensis]|uniref:vWA domain-containing protein n=1 Tax=Rhodopirellula bahusiensis TaxID=2014065 RepID=UPI00329A0540
MLAKIHSNTAGSRSRGGRFTLNRVASGRSKDRSGTTVVMLVILLPVMLAVAAYCINVVYMEMARTELQISTDLATRAAGRVLAVTGDKGEAIDAAERLLEANPYLNRTLSIGDADIIFGKSTRTEENRRYEFTPDKKVNSVSLRGFGADDVPMLFPTMGVPIEFRPIKQAVATQVELDIAIVLDRSGSMAFAHDEVAKNGSPAAAPPGWKMGHAVPKDARWLDTVAAVNGFLDIMDDSSHDERVSLSTYSDKSKADVKLTSDYTEIRAAMNTHSRKFKGGATNIGSGILAGGKTLGDKELARSWASRVLIVMSDGIHNTGTEPVPAAQQVANEQIMIFTVTFSDEANIQEMEKVAVSGGGQHFHAKDSQQLAEAFRKIAKSLPTLITF